MAEQLLLPLPDDWDVAYEQLIFLSEKISDIKLVHAIKLEKALADLPDKHETTLQWLKDNCPHKDLEKKHCYFSGNYTDNAYTIRWKQCKFCKKEFDTETETHSSYG